MKEVKIKILKDTPFDKNGTILSIQDFKLKYSYICNKYATNDEIINYISGKPPIINEFFEIVDYPLDFIYEGFVYRKEMDGFYHKFHPGVPFIPENCLGKIYIGDAESIINSAKFKKECLYLSDSVNKKL